MRGPLYAAAAPLAQRTRSLHRAKTTGADATATITILAAATNPLPNRVADIGCGRGTTTVALARQYPSAAIVAVDQSPALLAVVADRLRAQNHEALLVSADFTGFEGSLPTSTWPSRRSASTTPPTPSRPSPRSPVTSST
ncbi:class I SAM-dependent methyltransferase [Winogradskya humida]|uniref:class I SAM-dependent methyltransferase n=1 Tax=Winogradskya humida TaxID=113566 RepID=UPI001941ED59